MTTTVARAVGARKLNKDAGCPLAGFTYDTVSHLVITSNRTPGLAERSSADPRDCSGNAGNWDILCRDGWGMSREHLPHSASSPWIDEPLGGSVPNPPLRHRTHPICTMSNQMKETRLWQSMYGTMSGVPLLRRPYGGACMRPVAAAYHEDSGVPKFCRMASLSAACCNSMQAVLQYLALCRIRHVLDVAALDPSFLRGSCLRQQQNTLHLFERCVPTPCNSCRKRKPLHTDWT